MKDASPLYTILFQVFIIFLNILMTQHYFVSCPREYAYWHKYKR